jgi:hypothetical protein
MIGFEKVDGTFQKGHEGSNILGRNLSGQDSGPGVKLFAWLAALHENIQGAYVVIKIRERVDFLSGHPVANSINQLLLSRQEFVDIPFKGKRLHHGSNDLLFIFVQLDEYAIQFSDEFAGIA